MKHFYPLQTLICFLWLSCLPCFTQNTSVIYIENGNTEVGILSEVGGRIVVLRKTGQDNLLKATSELWEEPLSERPVPDANHPSMKSYFGQIVWVGPQADWWVQQNLNKRLRDAAAPWPPDPFLIYGDYRIIHRTDSSIVISGPESSVSGMQLVKEVVIDRSGRVHFKVTGKNISRQDIAWDLWCNLRMPGLTRCYVPVDDTADVRISFPMGPQFPMPHRLADGYFSFSVSDTAHVRSTGKAFIYPKAGWMAGFRDKQVLVIRFPRLAKERIHPDQGHAEIYQDIGPSSAMLLELEHHAAYQKLEPGETMSTEEVWEVLPCEGANTEASQLQFLKKVFGI